MFATLARKALFHPHDGLLSADEITILREQLVQPIVAASNIELLSPLTLKQREQFARETKTVVLYLGDEVPGLIQAEEKAALQAAPKGYGLEKLIGLNIGCGDRTISPFLLPVDILRETSIGQARGEHGALTKSAFLALSDNLPFKPNSIDYIVALHMLEHIENPVETVLHWLNIIKPGAGIGIVLPDWRYTWDARNDRAPYSHKWNSTPDLARKLYDEYWSSASLLESLDTYEYAQSFDFVLRKKGAFVPFSPPDPSTIKSGYQRFNEGIFLHGS